MLPLTAPQQELLDFIRHYIATCRIAPSIREMMAEMGVASPSPIQFRLEELRNKGYINWQPNRGRTVQVLADLNSELPVIGIIQSETGKIDLNAFGSLKLHGLKIPVDAFALQIIGDALEPVRLRHLDWLILRPFNSKSKAVNALAMIGYVDLVLGYIDLACRQSKPKAVHPGQPNPRGQIRAIAVSAWRDLHD